MAGAASRPVNGPRRAGFRLLRRDVAHVRETAFLPAPFIASQWGRGCGHV